jgi:hypothetical protein
VLLCAWCRDGNTNAYPCLADGCSLDISAELGGTGACTWTCSRNEHYEAVDGRCVLRECRNRTVVEVGEEKKVA